MHINHFTVAVSRETLKITSYTSKWMPLHCNLLLVLQSQVTNAIYHQFLRVFTI